MSFAYDANCISTIFSVTIQLILPLYVIAACILINRLRSHIVLPPKHQPWRIEEEVDDDDATTQKKTISTVRVVHECVCHHELRIRRTHIDLPIQDVDVPHIASSLQLPGSRRRERWSEWVTAKKIHAKDRIIEQCCVFVVWMEWLNWCPEPSNERQSVSRGCCSNERTPLVCCHHHPCIMSWHGGLFQFPSPSFSWWRQERHVFYSTDIKRHPRNNIVLFYPHHRRDIRLALCRRVLTITLWTESNGTHAQYAHNWNSPDWYHRKRVKKMLFCYKFWDSPLNNGTIFIATCDGAENALQFY